jgi:hypothetical protein
MKGLVKLDRKRDLGRDLNVSFSSNVRSALTSLVQEIESKDILDSDVLGILRDWSKGQRSSVHDVLTALPVVTEEVLKCLQTADDDRAHSAWREFTNQMAENGFSISEKTVQEGRS